MIIASPRLDPRSLAQLSLLGLATLGSSLLQGQQQLWGVLLGVGHQVLKALHLRQPADAAVLGESQVVIHNDLILQHSAQPTRLSPHSTSFQRSILLQRDCPKGSVHARKSDPMWSGEIKQLQQHLEEWFANSHFHH